MASVLRGFGIVFAVLCAIGWSDPSQAQSARSSAFGYDAASGLLTQEVIEPNLPAYRLQTDYSHDAFGNRVSVTVSGADIASRSATTTYDARGQFAVSATNALGHSESVQYDARFGLPTSQTGPNGLTTTWSYDAFGRRILEVRADGTRTTWSYQYCSGFAGGTASCPAGATNLVRVTPFAADGTTQNGPVATLYKDQLGREIAKDTQGFNGSLVRVSTEYNAKGQVARKSRPYFVSGGSPAWTTISYDAVGRPISETFPDTTSATYAYHGFVTSTTNAQNQTQTTTKNSQGEVVSVKDALNQTTSYVYDGFGNMTQVTDAAGNVTTASYDQRGRKVAANDPDLGAWSYAYNTLDQLTSQTDAKAQMTSVVYDLLGRTTQRTEPGLVSSWTFDTAANGIGRLASASTDTGYQRTHGYDTLGRPVQTQLTINSITHTFATTYDNASRVSAVTYPSGFAVSYAYNALGYQTQLINSATNQVYWTANARDAEGQLTQQTAGNGVVTTQSFNAQTGDLTGIEAGNNGGVANFAYTYDTLGKLLSRADANTGLSETFGYDGLNRLTSATVGVNTAKTFSYDTIGNLLSKSDVGTYGYPAAGNPRPHGVTSVTGSVINTTYTYDANGNQTSGGGLAIGYTAFNKPASITRGTATISFDHDPEHQRYRQVSASATTLYLGDGVVAAERVSGPGSDQWVNYLMAGGDVIGMQVEQASQPTLTRYFHKDHLGSISVITDEAGAVLERLSYDAWGKRRYADGTDDPTGSIASQSTRGFTGHEQLADVGLVHMNGRVYDPMLARFGTPDPMTESPFSTQGWNRYSYVGNSPVNFTDPSGYCFLGCFWNKAFKAIGRFLAKVPILRTIVAAVATVMCGGNPVCGVIASSATSAWSVGVTSGSLGKALRAGFLTVATAAAFHVVGTITLGVGHPTPAFASPEHLANIAGHAGVGCLASVASGGSCKDGAASAAVGAAATPLVDTGSFLGNTAAHAAVGGLASVAGGGKFSNGAETAAFGYMFNAEGGRALGRALGGAIGLFAGAPEGPLFGRLGYMLGRELGGQVLSDWEDNYYKAGPYSYLDDPTNVGAGKEFTPLQKQLIIQENMARNGGVVKSDLSGEVLVKKTGAYNPNEYQIDHRWPKAWGGSNSYGNAQVLSAAENRAKSTKLPW